MSSESFFSSEEFLGALAAAVYPGKPWRREVVEVEGRQFRVLVVGNRVIDGQWNHPFRYDPIEVARDHPTRDWPYLATTTLGTREASAIERFSWPVRPSPYIDWRGFSSWRAYQDFRRQPPGAHWKTINRLGRKLAREHGPLTFSLDDRAADVVPAMAMLKGAHFRRTGHLDWFQTSSTVRFYEELQRRNAFTYDTLRADGRLVAVVAGTNWGQRYYARTQTYDTEFRNYSPGLVLLHHLLRKAFERGDEEWDFLSGSEPYKWEYATHYRILAPLGRQPLRAALEHHLRGRVGTAIARVRQRAPARGQGLARV